MTYILMHNSNPIFAAEERVEAEARAVARIVVVDLFDADPGDDHEVLVEWTDTGKLMRINDTHQDQGALRFTGYEVRSVVSSGR